MLYNILYAIYAPPMLTFATKKLLTGTNRQREVAASFFISKSGINHLMII